jgi:hypothetical protein
MFMYWWPQCMKAQLLPHHIVNNSICQTSLLFLYFKCRSNDCRSKYFQSKDREAKNKGLFNKQFYNGKKLVTTMYDSKPFTSSFCRHSIGRPSLFLYFNCRSNDCWPNYFHLKDRKVKNKGQLKEICGSIW